MTTEYDVLTHKEFKLLIHILNNIVSKPSELKFRRLSKEKVLRRLVHMDLVIKLLGSIGFVEQQGVFVLPASVSLQPLKVASANISNAYKELTLAKAEVPVKPVTTKNIEQTKQSKSNAQTTTEEKKSEAQLRLEAIQARNKKLMAQSKAQKKLHREKMKAKLKENQDIVKERPINSSVGNVLAFGATLKAFEPMPDPPAQKKG